MIDNPVFSVTSEGITAPDFAEVLEYFQGRAREIFGDDINIDPDTQDGQLLSIFAAALSDVNAQAVAVYNQYNPSTAIGVGLDTAVKVNGIARKSGSHSIADLTMSGTAGTVINGGIVSDGKHDWNLPTTVIIPAGGTIVVSATCADVGAIEAEPNTINQIQTPTLGWDGAENLAAAFVGTAQETDADLRTRQAVSTESASLSTWAGLVGALWRVPGVTLVGGVHNDTDAAVDGVPAHSVAMVVAGGDSTQISETIHLRKGAGVSTYGNQNVIIPDDFGGNYSVKWSRPIPMPIFVRVQIKADAGYITERADEIKQRIAEYINGAGLGVAVVTTRMIAAAIRGANNVYDDTFVVQDLTAGTSAGSLAAGVIQVAWNKVATCQPENVEVVVSDV